MSQSSSDITRQKLIHAATEVFSEVGYKAATVREIVRRAEVNQAAINYHFRGKDALYCEVMRRAFHQAEAATGADIQDNGLSPEHELRRFMENTMTPMLEAAPGAEGYARLLAWEMIEPSGFLDNHEKEGPAQHHQQVMEIARKFLPEKTPEHEVAWAAFWLLGQCSIVRQAEALMKQMPPDLVKSLKENKAEMPRFFMRLALHGLKRPFEN